jgi:hypothetical protein
MKTLTIELVNDNAIHLLQDLELLNIIRLPNKNIEIPDWHKAILEERIADYEVNSNDVKDFDELLDEVEKSI